MTEDKAINKKELADIIKHERNFLDPKINFFTQTERELMTAEILEEINHIFNNLSDDNKVLLKEIIESVATFKVTARELNNMVVTRGPLEYFKNGSQKFVQETKSREVYSKTLKDLMGTVKYLIAVSNLKENSTQDELMDFINAIR